MVMPNFSPRMGGRMNLAEKKRRLLRFHWIEMEIMEILSSWSETMVYIPLRTGVGRQMWEQALNCDRIGWALRNLRHLGRVVVSRAPTDEFARFCEQLHATRDPLLRLVGMHRVLIPALAAAEREYLDAYRSTRRWQFVRGADLLHPRPRDAAAMGRADAGLDPDDSRSQAACGGV